MHTVRIFLAVHPHYCAFKADAKNAFNEAFRHTILAELRIHFPQLFSYVAQFMGPEAPRLLCSIGKEGIRYLHSSEGVQQGDPLGPFLVALGLHPALLRL